MGNSLIGWTNAVKTAVLTASSADPALPVTNLSGDQGNAAAAWQTLAGALTPLLTITPAARTTFRAIGIFRTNLTTAGTMIARLYTNPGAVLVATASTITAVNGQAVVVLPADVAADIVTVALSDAANPDNHLNVPLAFAGPVWMPATAMAWTSSMGRDEISDTVVTRGGQVFVDLRASFRRWEIALDGVRTSEAFAQLDVLDRFSRAGGNVLMIPNITLSSVQSEATFGVLKATADVTFPLSIFDRRSWRARLTERL